MKITWKDGKKYIIKVNDGLFFYGDENSGYFSSSENAFLRFNPYMVDVSEEKIIVPKSVEAKIEELKKKHKNQGKFYTVLGD